MLDFTKRVSSPATSLRNKQLLYFMRGKNHFTGFAYAIYASGNFEVIANSDDGSTAFAEVICARRQADGDNRCAKRRASRRACLWSVVFHRVMPGQGSAAVLSGHAKIAEPSRLYAKFQVQPEARCAEVSSSVLNRVTAAFIHRRSPQNKC
jgi:hypothetical protein